MNVRPTSSEPLAPAVSATGAVRANDARPSATDARPAPPSGLAAGPAGGDRVEISPEARAQTAARTEPLDLEVARTALRVGSKMDPARLHELRERVRTGYYDHPEAVDRIAEAVVREMVGGEE